MFDKTARIYDAVYGFKDYPAEAKRVMEIIRQHARDARSLLDVGCGTGRHIESWMGELECTGIDLDEGMLATAAQRCPHVRLLRADMTGFDLGETFDVVVSLFSSIGYARTPERLTDTATAMVRHLAPGGVLIVEPWLTPDRCEPGHMSIDTVDEPELKVARIGRVDVDGRRSTIRMDYLVGTPKGVEHVQEAHELGLFTDEEYRAAFAGAGVPVERREGFHGRGLYVGVRPA